jgi:LEA14-like dessication related protein
MRKFLFYLLVIFALTACKSQRLFVIEEPAIVEEEPAIKVKDPEFHIVSIAIIQADLVNTQFEAVIRIDNANEFALELSSLSYELYGNGKFWADGRGIDVLYIPAQSSCETEFIFTMNFINMSRKLLDDVIAMRRVQYRFSGDVEVDADIPRIPPFQMTFERSGFSEVKEKAGKKTQSAKVYTNTLQPSIPRYEVDSW